MDLYGIDLNRVAVIKSINLKKEEKNRLEDLGVFIGDRVVLIRKCFLGGPIEIKIKGFYMAIRKNQAKKITVEYE